MECSSSINTSKTGWNIVLTKTWIEVKRPKTSQNDPKFQRLKIGEIWNFLLAFFSNFEPKCPNFWHFGSKSINFLVFTKFYLYPISKKLISNLTLFFENFEPKCPFMGILFKKYKLSNLNEILPVIYFEGADFKSNIGFQKPWAQMPKIEHLSQGTNLNSLLNSPILAKFSLYATSNVLISNLTFAFCGS